MSVPVTLSGGIFSDILLWIRRIIKSPSDQTVSDAFIGDYVNRFYVYDMPENIQLFELLRQYTFLTVKNRFIYQAPFFQDKNGRNNGVPQYQNFRPPVYADGIQMGYYQSNDQFYNIFPELVQNEQPLMGDNSSGPYSVRVGRNPILRGFTDDLGNLEPYVFVTAIDSSGIQRYIVDNGEGDLINTDPTFQLPQGFPLNPATTDFAGFVDYDTGEMEFTFNNNVIPPENPITVQTSPFSSGFPRLMQFYNNLFRLYPVPDRPYKIQIDANITPSQFLNTSDSIPFAYLSEYIARGAARKILSDNGDYEQFAFYEPLFREQENLALRRTTRQRAVERTPTIFSGQTLTNPYIYTQF